MSASAPRWGMTIPLPGVSLRDHRSLVERLAEWGYTDLWTAEVAGLDALTPLAAAASWSSDLRFGSAIASIFSRGPALLAMEAASLADLAPDRFVLGLGSSSPLLVEGWNAGRLHRPHARMRDTLDFLDRALRGERIDEQFESFSVRGFALERPPAVPPRLMVAGLRSKMLGLAGARSAGAILGLVTPQDIPAMARKVHDAGPGREIAMRIGVYPTSDIELARAHCRRILATYLNVPAYAALHEELGRGSEIARIAREWRRGDRGAAVEAVPPDWVDEFFAVGSPSRCRERVESFVEAGVTAPILSIMSTPADPGAALRALSRTP